MVTIDDLCELPAGWIAAFGNDLVRDLNGAMGDVAQEVYVKEKWGSLSAYISFSSDDIEVVVDKYKRIARQTCAGCGAPARRVSTGWILPWCDNCGSPQWKYKLIETYLDGEY